MSTLFTIFLVMFGIGGLLTWVVLVRIMHALEGLEESFDIWRKK